MLTSAYLQCKRCGAAVEKHKECHYCKFRPVATIEAQGVYISVNNCSDVCDLWDDKWEMCPLCGAHYLDGYIMHSGPKPILN